MKERLASLARQYNRWSAEHKEQAEHKEPHGWLNGFEVGMRDAWGLAAKFLIEVLDEEGMQCENCKRDKPFSQLTEIRGFALCNVCGVMATTTPGA